MEKEILIDKYDDLRNRLRVRLVDMKSNEEALRNAVYQPVGCGYALVAYMEISEKIEGYGDANVQKELAENAEFSNRSIVHNAMCGSVNNKKPKLSNISDVLLGRKAENLLDTGGPVNDVALMVLTTNDERLGASALYYPGMTKRIGEIVGRDYFVLPSSIHEVLIMPDNGRTNPEKLAMIVKSINEREVSPNERLGNRVLHYRLDLQKLQVASDMDREKDRGRGRE